MIHKFRSDDSYQRLEQLKTRIQVTKCWEIVQSTHKTEIVNKTDPRFFKVIYGITNLCHASLANATKHLRKK